MLQQSKLQTLVNLVESSTKEELMWMNGYLSGIVAQHLPAQETQDSPDVPTKTISLVFGTETGNSKAVATKLVAAAKKKGVNIRLTNLNQYRLSNLSEEEYLFVVISTQGEGEPPVPARAFYDYIHAQQLALPRLKYGVLALGDTSYPLFCKTGEDVDTRFESFGATRVLPLQKCDVDYEDDATQWLERVLQLVNTSAVTAPTLSKPEPSKKQQSRKYYEGKILANINLNDRESNKQTYHIEIGTSEQIHYEPGDTIGIIPRNRVEVVDRIVALTGIDPLEVIATAKVTAPVNELLTDHLNICYLMTSTIRKYAAIVEQEIPDTRMDLVDLLRIYPVKDASQFARVIGILLPVAPRLYSIASSPAAHGNNEVHITVARANFLAQDEQRYGLCSEFLGDQPLNSSLSFYVHKDKHFKLPSRDKDIIMIGPGTGVAPFRSFLAERDATGATGKNWFFFGEQYFLTDFLYQTDIQKYAETGVLTHLSLAFSRDQQEKIYVQHRMLERAGEFYQWIENGASVFISGTKYPMSKDVEQALLQLIASEGEKTQEQALAYLEEIKKQGRYQKDVY